MSSSLSFTLPLITQVKLRTVLSTGYSVTYRLDLGDPCRTFGPYFMPITRPNGPSQHLSSHLRLHPYSLTEDRRVRP